MLALGFLAAAHVAGAQPIRVSDNGRTLEYADGRPFFYLADTAWELFHRLNRTEVDAYLRNRAGKGFTAVQAVLLSEINGLTVPNAEGHLPLVDVDPARPNDAYFSLVDFAVERAAELGLVLALLPTWGAHVEDDPHPVFDNVHVFTPENARAYGRFLGARYRDRMNVIWVLGGDRSPEGHEAVWDALAAGLKEGMLGRHLISYHPRGYTSSSDRLHDRTWLDFNMIQVGHRRRSNIDYEFVRKDYERTPAKPVVNGETTYEDLPVNFSEANERFDAGDVRKAAYWSVFAGACGHAYGNNSVWQMVREGDEPILGARQPWWEALESPGAFQMRHLKDLLLSRPYASRFPDQSLILPTSEVDPPAGLQSDHVQATRDGTPGRGDATYVMAYLPQAGRVRLDSSVIPGKWLRVWWYCPVDGNAYPVGRVENRGVYETDAITGFRPPQSGADWVIVLDDDNADYPPPGGKR